jgi:hypothetical protein
VPRVGERFEVGAEGADVDECERRAENVAPGG